MNNEMIQHAAQYPSKYDGAFSSAESFEAAQRMAMALCSSTMVPKHYQGKENIGNTIIALEMAQRMGASPLMIMQNLYIVHGNPGWSAKFLIATFNQCGRFSAIRYEWKGTPGQKDRACRAWAVEKQTDKRVEGPWIDWALIDGEGWARNNGSKWLTMPEKMFQYRAAAWMIDTVAPELSMGLPPADQLEDIIEIDPATGNVIDRNMKKTTLADLKSASPRHASNAESKPSQETDQPTDANGEIWNPEIHATSKDGLPVYNSDGTFRAKRGTKKHKEGSGNQQSGDGEEPTFAQLAEDMKHAAEENDRDELDALMDAGNSLPDEQRDSLKNLYESLVDGIGGES